MTDENNPREWFECYEIIKRYCRFRSFGGTHPTRLVRLGPIERVPVFCRGTHLRARAHTNFRTADDIAMWCVTCVYKYIYARVRATRRGKRDAMAVSDGHACLHGSMRFRLCGDGERSAPGPSPPIRSRLLLLLRNARQREFFPALARIVIRAAVSCYCYYTAVRRQGDYGRRLRIVYTV